MYTVVVTFLYRRYYVWKLERPGCPCVEHERQHALAAEADWEARAFAKKHNIRVYKKTRREQFNGI